MDVNIGAVLAATAVMFAIGAFWYMVPFGKIWGTMHGFDKLSKKEQKEAQAQMGPYYSIQLAVTIISAWVLAYFMVLLPDMAFYKIAFWVWLGFIVPTTASNVIFGGTESKWIVRKTLISVGGSFACTLAGAWVISLF